MLVARGGFMTGDHRPSDLTNDSLNINVTANFGPPEKPKGPGSWAYFVAGAGILALAIIIALVIVVMVGDPTRAQTLAAFVRALFQAP